MLLDLEELLVKIQASARNKRHEVKRLESF